MLLKKSEFADLAKVTKALISRAIDSGRVALAEDGKHLDTMHEINANFIEKRLKKINNKKTMDFRQQEKDKVTLNARLGKVTRLPGVEDQLLQTEKLKMEKLQAEVEKLALQNAKTKEDNIPIESVQKYFAIYWGILNNNLLEMPRHGIAERISGKIQMMMDGGVGDQEINIAIENILVDEIEKQLLNCKKNMLRESKLKQSFIEAEEITAPPEIDVEEGSENDPQNN